MRSALTHLTVALDVGFGRSFHLVPENVTKENEMSLIGLVVVLIVVGVLMWLVNTHIPMAASIKNILNVVVVIAVVLWLLNVFGLFAGFQDIRIGR